MTAARTSGLRVRRGRVVGLVLLLLLCAVAVVPAAPAQAAAFVVTNCMDSGVSGDGSLRGEILAASAGATVTFQANLKCSGANAIKLDAAKGTLAINNDLTIDGTGATIAVDGGCTGCDPGGTPSGGVTVFTVNAGTVTLNALTIQHGTGVGSGGIYGFFSTNMTVTNCTITGNVALDSGGGITSLNTLTVTNSTIIGNAAPNFGGGIFAAGSLTVTSSTIAGNAAARGGGINNQSGVTDILTNTIVANSTSGGDLTTVAGPFTGTNNLIDDTSAIGGTGNITNTPALLGTLGNYGGSTPTIPLLPGSPAIDTGAAIGQGPSGPNPPANLVPSTDQRGKPRAGGAPDIGAYESQGFSLVVTTNGDDGTANIANCETGLTAQCRLRDAIALVTATPAYGTTITFAANMTITLSGSTLTLAADMAIDGTGHTVAVDGGCTFGSPAGCQTGTGVPVFTVNTGVTASLTALTIQHGNGGTGSGGINNNGGALTVIGGTLLNNSAPGGGRGAGGGIANIGGTLQVTNSTLSGNTADAIGGGIDNENGTVTLTNVTLTGNVTGSGTTGGIRNRGGTVTLTNTIVAGNSGDLNVRGNPFSGSNNLIGDMTGAAITSGSNNIVNRPALLGSLGNYSGMTQTVPLLPGSPAIDAGDDTTCAAALPGGAGGKDQRGITRPQPTGGHCDIGAFESQGFTLTKTGDGQSTAAATAFPTPLAVSVASTHSEPVDGGTVTFTVVPNGGAQATFGTLTGCTVTGGTLAGCTISGGVATTPALTASLTLGTFTVTAAATGATTQTFTLTIAAPTITFSPATLPGGVRNIAYPANTMLTATGGTVPYAFTVTLGTLPPGLTLATSGALTGTPTTVGQYPFTVTATDKNGFTGTQQYTITVTPAALFSITVSPNTTTLKVGDKQQLTAMATYADNSTADITAQVIWSSDATAVVTVDANGKATGQTGGTAHLTATQSGVTSNPATVTVTPPTATGITVGPAPSGRPSGTAGSSDGSPAPSPAPPSGGTTGNGRAPNSIPGGR